MSISILKAAVVALALVNPAVSVYTLDASDIYSGANFFNMFNFNSSNDPTGGFVDYQTQAQAQAKALIGYNSAKDRSYIGVDSTSVLSTAQSPSNRGRASVRLESKKMYTKGMFVLDVFHMPQEACGVWPAFWTVHQSADYPRWGEIDILENINEQTSNLNTLHTSPGCTIAGGSRMTDVVDSYNCDDKSNNAQGCSARNTQAGVYGSAFNNRGGGTIAMEWSTNFIKMWNFAPTAVPANLKSGNPDTTTWGTPAFTTEGGSCVMNDHFANHQVIIDTTFCGFYAGQDYFWQQTSCYKNNPTKYDTCLKYVAANPGAFANAYWIINSLKVYKWQ